MDREGSHGAMPIPLDCSLDASAGRSRVEEWTALRPVLRSNRFSEDAKELYLRFDNSRDVALALRRLAAEEESCCSGASFNLQESRQEVLLTISGDPHVLEAFARLEPARQEEPSPADS